MIEKRFGIGGFFGKAEVDEEVAKLNFAFRSNQTGPHPPSNNWAELESIERIIEIGVKHGISALEVRTDTDFSIKN